MFKLGLAIVVALNPFGIWVYDNSQQACAKIKERETIGWWIVSGITSCPAIACMPSPKTGLPDPNCGKCSTHYSLLNIDCAE